MIRVVKASNYRLGWSIHLIFQVALSNEKDEGLLNLIQNYFGVGSVYKTGTRSSLTLKVSSVKDLVSVIKHFDRYPLITNKLADYLLFKEVVCIVQRKEHLTLEGLEKVVAIKASINKGLPDELKAAFPYIIPVKRSSLATLPALESKKILDPHWLSGFSSGGNCFFVDRIPSVAYKTGFKLEFRFQLTQRIREEVLMRSLVEYLGCGNLYFRGEIVDFVVNKYSDLESKIIPFFNKYPIVGDKFQNFLRLSELIKENKYLTHTEGEVLGQDIKKVENNNKAPFSFKRKWRPLPSVQGVGGSPAYFKTVKSKDPNSPCGIVTNFHNKFNCSELANSNITFELIKSVLGGNLDDFDKVMNKHIFEQLKYLADSAPLIFNDLPLKGLELLRFTFNVGPTSQITLKNRISIKGGVYIWTHAETGEINVGSSVMLANRLRCYYLARAESGRLGDRPIESAIKKYGLGQFRLKLYILTPDIINLIYPEGLESDIISNKEYKFRMGLVVKVLEQMFILRYNPTLNELKIAGSIVGIDR